MRAVYTTLATTLMAVAFAGVLSPLLVFIIAGLTGIVRPSDLGMRMALVGDTMPPDHLVAAMGVSRTTSDCARVAGAIAGAGMFAAFGIAPAYVAVASLYAIGLALTMAIASANRLSKAADPAASGGDPSAWRDLREGIAYVWSTPQLLAAMLLACLLNLTAYPISNGLLPYVAKDIYRIDQTGLGYLVASFAFGALLGSVTVSLRGAVKAGRAMILSALAWYAMLLPFAQMREPHGGCMVLMLAGFAQSICMVTLAVLLLRTTSGKFRGRVMGVRMLAIYSLPFGLLAAGFLVGRIGFSATGTLYAVMGLLFTVVIAVRWRAALWHSDTPASAR